MNGEKNSRRVSRFSSTLTLCWSFECRSFPTASHSFKKAFGPLVMLMRLAFQELADVLGDRHAACFRFALEMLGG